MKKLILSLFILSIFIFALSNVSAVYSRVSGNHCVGDEISCPDGHAWYDPVFGYRCDDYAIIGCNGACDDATGTCLGGGNGAVCNEGYQACCSSPSDCVLNIPRSSGSSYKCLSGQWVLNEQCNMGCTEDSYNHASCDVKKYYCKGTTSCFWSTQNNANCFDTQSQCENSLLYCCTTATSGRAIYGLNTQCNAGENKMTYTGMTVSECNNIGKPGNNLTVCGSCDAFAQSTLYGWILPSKKCIGQGITYDLIPPFIHVEGIQNELTCSPAMIKYLIYTVIGMILVLIIFLYFKNNKGRRK